MMHKEEEKPAVKKTAAKEKAPAGTKRKKAHAAPEGAPLQTEGALHGAHPVEAGAKEEHPRKKTARAGVRKKAAEHPEAGHVPAAGEAATLEKPARKPRAKLKKEAPAPAAPEIAPAEKAVEAAVKPEEKHAKKAEAAPHAPAKPEERKAAQAPAAPHVPAHPPVHKPAHPHVAAPKPAVAPAAGRPPVAAPAAVKPPVAVPEKPAAPVIAPPPAPEAPKIKGQIKINEMTTVRDLAEKMNQKPGDIIRKLIGMGSLATINQRLDVDTSGLLAHEFGYEVKFESLYAEEVIVEVKDEPAKLKPRSAVVTIMGHVDHGKTSLLDSIRESKVAEGEAGGITQHIGAYRVKLPKGELTFLDTPGHEAFTAMRSRGAQATDIVVLVVSSTDGVMPQTVEAIDHARAAGVPIIVAVNKIDLPGANPAQVKQELSKYNLVPEEWGGDTIMVDVSAKTKTNIDQLLEMVVLKSEMMELKANPDRLARGVVIEAKLDSRRGPVATMLVQNGTLNVGDNVVVGTTFGKVRAMIDEHGHRLETAVPSTPVEILGLNTPPQAGDQFIVVEQEYQAREIAQSRQTRAREESLRPRHHLSLEDISQGKVKELRLILKTDVQGSLGALSDSLERLSTAEINLKIIHSGAGGITESDVTLAAASDALIIGFNIRTDATVERLADQEGVNIRTYRIIYEVIADVKAAMEGMLEPQIKETSVGKAQVKQVFKVTKVGTIAGSTVLDGKILRNARVRLLRDNVIVYEGSIASLHRFKDDVKEVDKGFECGIGLENFTDIKPGDIMEAFTQEKIARKL
ncbi:MAG: translation initiation factor IF-2 [Endomicrobiales bacterium]